MRIAVAGNDPLEEHACQMANAVGRAIEKEFITRLPNVHVRELMYEVCPIAHRLTLEYKGKRHTYHLPSENSLQTAPAFCEAIVEKLVHDLTPMRLLPKGLRALHHRIFHDG
jgi:hypothetical protein